VWRAATYRCVDAAAARTGKARIIRAKVGPICEDSTTHTRHDRLRADVVLCSVISRKLQIAVGAYVGATIRRTIKGEREGQIDLGCAIVAVVADVVCGLH